MHLSMFFDPDACIYDAANLSPTDGQADSRSWMQYACIQDASIHDESIHDIYIHDTCLRDTCLHDTCMALDLDGCVYDAYVFDP